MNKVPISLIVDDPAPVVSTYYAHSKNRFTKDGRPLQQYVPNSMLDTFCDITEKWGIKGKFSVIPIPGNLGDIINGIPNVPYSEIEEWLNTVKKRLIPSFSICPEMLTHRNAIDLATMTELPVSENVWSSTQDRTTLTPYITYALTLLKQAGIRSTGVTSPWDFGIAVEDEYAAALSKAVYEVSGSTRSWYFLRSLDGVPDARPWIQLEEEGRTTVAIPSTVGDYIRRTIDTTDESVSFICSIADMMITEDGRSGEILDVLNTGGWPVLLTHWQYLISNGPGTGMKVLDTVGRRVREHLSDRVEWMSFEEIMDLVIAEKREEKHCPKR